MAFFVDGEVVISSAGANEDACACGEFSWWQVNGEVGLMYFSDTFVYDFFFVFATFCAGGVCFPEGNGFHFWPRVCCRCSC